MTFSDWIKTTGEPDIARKMGVAVGTVYSWASRNQIPRAVWPELLVAYRQLGLNDLLAMESASRQDA